MARKSKIRKFFSWLIGKFGRSKIDNSVESGCRKLADAERDLEGRISDAENSGEDAGHLRGELNTVRENMEILGC